MRLTLATIALLYCILRVLTAPAFDSPDAMNLSNVLLVFSFHAPPVIGWCLLTMVSGGLCGIIINDELNIAGGETDG